MGDTLMRQWQMLRMIPRHPARISTTVLQQRLEEEGFETSPRTIQRDLARLSAIYPLQCDERGKPFGWSWMADAEVLDIPGMDAHTALAFWMAEKHLAPLLPQPTLSRLRPHFSVASMVLDAIGADAGAPAWRRKLRVLHRGPDLKPPAVSDEVQHAVHEALLHNRCLSVRYRSRARRRLSDYEQVHPLALVVKDGVSYLLCTLWDYDDVRQLALHRLRKANVLDEPARRPQGFDLDAYIASGAMQFDTGERIELVALFSDGAAWHLEERPLGRNQKLTPQDDGRVRLSVTVRDSSELRWWLLGYGDEVEVLAPEALRAEFAAIAARMHNRYNAG